MTAIDLAILGADGSRWDIAGTNAGVQGAIIAAEQVDGIYDAPVEQEWMETADGIGSVPVGPVRYKARDILLGFHLFEDDYATGRAPGALESDFRMALAVDRDRWDPAFKHARLVATTDLSGSRMLTVQCFEAPEIDLGDDRIDEEYFNAKYNLRAGMPLWEGPSVTTVFEAATTSASGIIVVSNPTDIPMRHTFKLTRATWTISDTSWEGAKGARVPGGAQANRSITLEPITDADGGVIITRDRSKLHAQTFSGTNFLSRMNGNWVAFDIPPYTPETELPISYTSAPSGGARAEILQPRLWSRPWGMELP